MYCKFNNCFFNTHFFSTFSRNDQVLHVALFPEIQFYLKEFPTVTVEEKNNALTWQHEYCNRKLAQFVYIKKARYLLIFQMLMQLLINTLLF